MTREIETLLSPISADAPCGVDLEYTPLLSGFDAYRLFGMDTPLSKDLDWRQIRDKSLEALGQSHDFRLLAHLAAAVVRIEGLNPFLKVITVADRWLSEYWDSVFPRVDDDAILRKNALNSFADRMAIVDAVRRAPFVLHRQLGAFSLRDLEIAQGRLTPAESETNVPQLAQIEAALAATPPAQLTELSDQLRLAIVSLKNIVTTMNDRGGSDSAPDFDGVIAPLFRIQQLLIEHTPAAARTDVSESPGIQEDVAMGVGSVTAIKSRQDAIRALDAVSEFFRANEPSSPVPMFIERAKRLVSKTFIEVLQDIAPEGVNQAKLIGGIKSDDGQ